MDRERLVKLGAQARIKELQEELAELQALVGDEPRKTAAPERARKVERRPLSAKEKAVISKRMKKYWAARRAKKD
jgi:hypothetical protein